MKYGIIYRAYLDDGRSYIGQTIKILERRISEHKCNTRTGKTHFYNSLRKYKFESFKWELLEECNNQDELNICENKWIKHFNSIENGFNLREGGSRGKHSEETKKLISEKNTGEGNGMFGKEAWNSGKELTQQHIENLSKSHKGQIPWNKGKSGYNTKPCSDEKKQAISNKNSAENNGQAKLTWNKVRDIRQMAKNGILLKDIAKIFNISSGHVSSIVNNKQWKE